MSASNHTHFILYVRVYMYWCYWKKNTQVWRATTKIDQNQLRSLFLCEPSFNILIENRIDQIQYECSRAWMHIYIYIHFCDRIVIQFFFFFFLTLFQRISFDKRFVLLCPPINRLSFWLDTTQHHTRKRKKEIICCFQLV